LIFENLIRVGYTLLSMEVRSAKITDAKAISSLINSYAEQDKMLFRSMADIYENLQSFTVVELNGRVVGCCALQVIWSDLAEIKSLAVDQINTKKGIGSALVAAAVEQAAKLGAARVFALTLYPDFFVKQGFEVIQKDKLPMKVWSDCAKCPKQQNCDETAVIKKIRNPKHEIRNKYK
jgi:amino-acid N-acetyltransferase